MFGGHQISFRRFQGTFRNYRPRELRGLRSYNREVSTSAALEQDEGEYTSGENLPPALENGWHGFVVPFTLPVFEILDGRLR